MKDTLPDTTWKTTKIFVVFCIVVLLCIVGSLLFRGIKIYLASTFDGKHRFTFSVTTPKKKVAIVSIEPFSQSANVVLLTGSYKEPDIQALPIVVDAKIELQRELDGEESVISIVSHDVLRGHAKVSGATIFDLVRLFVAIKTMPKANIVYEKMSLPFSESPVLLFKNYFSDGQVVRDDVTIAIVNASGISGLGTKLEQEIRVLGGRVVSVTTARTETKQTQVSFTGDKGYTVWKIEKIVGEEAKQIEKEGVSDILIVLGQDSASHSLFLKK